MQLHCETPILLKLLSKVMAVLFDELLLCSLLIDIIKLPDECANDMHGRTNVFPSDLCSHLLSDVKETLFEILEVFLNLK